MHGTSILYKIPSFPFPPPLCMYACKYCTTCTRSSHLYSPLLPGACPHCLAAFFLPCFTVHPAELCYFPLLHCAVHTSRVHTSIHVSLSLPKFLECKAFASENVYSDEILPALGRGSLKYSAKCHKKEHCCKAGKKQSCYAI